MAALYDIHANLPALESVIADVRRRNVDHIVIGGDVVPGPMPRETLDYLLALDIRVQFIYGNGEVAVLQQLHGHERAAVPEAYRPLIRWVAQQLTPEHERTLASWPATLRMHIAGLGEVLFCHATPRNENEIFTQQTSEARLLPAFASTDAAVVVCGHTHMQFSRSIANTRIVNAGSVGMPFGERGAHWLLLGPEVELCCTAYDFAAAAEQIRATTYPQAEEFAERSILRPPAAQEMIELFSKAELT